ncbi:hypothetical protein [Bradyrhizobium sp.]|uniref:hypothetical protein n=1 Tax=Bradyrhizobium sp. TaxID=376 RepID=UPI003C4D9425
MKYGVTRAKIALRRYRRLATRWWRAMAWHRNVENATIAIIGGGKLDNTVLTPEQLNLKLPEGNSVSG